MNTINPLWPERHPCLPCSRGPPYLDQAGQPPQRHLSEQHPVERGIDRRGAGIACLPARCWAAGPSPVDGRTKRVWGTKLQESMHSLEVGQLRRTTGSGLRTHIEESPPPPQVAWDLRSTLSAPLTEGMRMGEYEQHTESWKFRPTTPV